MTIRRVLYYAAVVLFLVLWCSFLLFVRVWSRT